MLARNAFQKFSNPTSKNLLRVVRHHQPRCVSSSSTSTMTSARASTSANNDDDLTLVHDPDIRRGVEHKSLSLGLRSSSPPDSVSPKPGKKSKNKDLNELSDAEWEIRTGRALFVLQETLPEFFKTGLVVNVDKGSGAPVRSSSVLPLSLGPSANPLDFLTQSPQSPTQEADNGVEPIYSPKVKLEYTPPTPLPAPFPRTLHLEGFPLYLASAAFMRHTMNALYSDLLVTLLKVSLNVPPSAPHQDSSHGELNEESRNKSPNRRRSREKSVIVRFIVTGKTRVSGGLSEWEVESTYTFSPVSGLIHKQVINSIHPAPTQAVYDSLSKLLGFGWSSGGESIGKGPATGTMCNNHSK